jgi:hypothetical protein
MLTAVERIVRQPSGPQESVNVGMTDKLKNLFTHG